MNRATIHLKLLVVMAFVATLIFVNPLRGGAMFDDWAYTWTVQHWLQTGSYRLHDWLSANMPFQALVGAAFYKALGATPGALRLSTLFLFGCGLAAFYRLAQEHDLDSSVASMLTLALLASPLVLLLSFTYMTDVPFLSCIVFSLALYTRAIRLQSAGGMVVASLAASAAILTRQFGVGLLGGLLVSWLASTQSRKRLGFYALGAIAPVLATGWQLYAGTLDPNWCAVSARLAQAQYLAQPTNVLKQYLIRIPASLHYFALFTAPLIPLGCAAVLSANFPRWPHVLRRFQLAFPESATDLLDRRQVFFLLFVVAWGALALVLSTSIFMPYLPWYFGFLADFGALFSAMVLVTTTAGALLITRAFFLRYSVRWTQLTPSQRFLDYATASLFALQMTFYKLGDEYLLHFIPAVLIVLGWSLRAWLAAYPKFVASSCIAMLVSSALWTRGTLATSEARWIAADSVLQQGVPATDIYASWDWMSYHRYSEYLADIQGRPMTDFDDFFERWIPAQASRARFLTGTLPPGTHTNTFTKIGEVPYRSISLRKRSIPIWKRNE